jgi:hypothetical protein
MTKVGSNGSTSAFVWRIVDGGLKSETKAAKAITKARTGQVFQR